MTAVLQIHVTWLRTAVHLPMIPGHYHGDKATWHHSRAAPRTTVRRITGEIANDARCAMRDVPCAMRHAPGSSDGRPWSSAFVHPAALLDLFGPSPINDNRPEEAT